LIQSFEFSLNYVTIAFTKQNKKKELATITYILISNVEETLKELIQIFVYGCPAITERNI